VQHHGGRRSPPGTGSAPTNLIRPVRMPERMPWGKLIDHNLYWNVNTGRFLAADLDWEGWRAKGHDRGSVFADPLFAEPAHATIACDRVRPRSRSGSATSDGWFRPPHDTDRALRGEFEGEATVSIMPDSRGGEVRYTIDGGEPGPSSTLYGKRSCS